MDRISPVRPHHLINPIEDMHASLVQTAANSTTPRVTPTAVLNAISRPFPDSEDGISASDRARIQGLVNRRVPEYRSAVKSGDLDSLAKASNKLLTEFGMIFEKRNYQDQVRLMTALQKDLAQQSSSGFRLESVGRLLEATFAAEAPRSEITRIAEANLAKVNLLDPYQALAQTTLTQMKLMPLDPAQRLQFVKECEIANTQALLRGFATLHNEDDANKPVANSTKSSRSLVA